MDSYLQYNMANNEICVFFIGKKIGDVISEDAFVKTVSKRVQGKINLTEEEAAEQTEAYKRSSIFTKVCWFCL